MTRSAQFQGADEIEAPSVDNSPFRRFCHEINRHHNIVTLIKQLHHMISVVQLHRGMSMSFLGGNTLFDSEIQRLQGQLEKRLLVLETFVAFVDDLVSGLDKRNLHQAWMTIRHDWEDDKLLDNFELHSHFIEQLLAMIGNLAIQLEQPLLFPLPAEQQEAPEYGSHPTSFRLRELLNFISRQLPQMIEMLARMRGLASHAATVGQVEYVQDRKLRYLLQCAREQNEKLRHQSRRLGNIWDKQLPSLGDIASSEMKVLFLFGTVESDILGGQEIIMESHRLFKLATEIIDIYSGIAENGWDLVRRQLDNEMENRLQASVHSM